MLFPAGREAKPSRPQQKQRPPLSDKWASWLRPNRTDGEDCTSPRVWEPKQLCSLPVPRSAAIEWQPSASDKNGQFQAGVKNKTRIAADCPQRAPSQRSRSFRRWRTTRCASRRGAFPPCCWTPLRKPLTLHIRMERAMDVGRVASHYGPRPYRARRRSRGRRRVSGFMRSALCSPPPTIRLSPHKRILCASIAAPPASLNRLRRRA